MEIIPLLQKELEQEVIATRKLLSLVPTAKFDFKPHEKNMTMKQLAVHIAELAGWISMGLHTEGLDFAAQTYEQAEVSSTQDILDLFDKSLAEGKEALANAKEEDLLPTWTMSMGEQVLMKLSKYEVIRHALGQMIHHRAQLGIFLRMLNVPLPKTYGPTADDSSF